ncbi:MAG: CCA tRNA nucleotidyltransferase [Candidatus Bathyarchaeia archaeon]|jgi:tRNA nucleotidyltransferase (CCA-adding enzyme)
MQHEKQRVLATVLKRATPKKDERANIGALARKLERKVTSASKQFGLKAKVRVEGSVAKDTWLSGEPDVDVFMRVPVSIPRDSLGEVCLKVAKEATKGSEQIERFAEHPYLEAFVDGTRVNVVPCYATKRGEWLSATDRTPFHTDYINKNLDVQMRGQVRLLKKFMKGIGVYGAEIKVGGFSGYLCELLVLHHGSFLDAVEAFAKYKQRMVIDIEDFYGKRQREVDLLFEDPLVVVDPVDKARNVASAVRKQNLDMFIAAAQAFMKRPNLNFFYPPPTIPMNAGKMKKTLERRRQGPTTVFVAFGRVDAVPDILWGQLYKSLRSMHKLVSLSDFSLLRDFAWSDEKDFNVFGFELEHCCIPEVKKHLGPPLEKESECEKFLLRHQNASKTVSGPYIEDGRWVVEVRRNYTDACALLREKLKDGGKNAGVAEGISHVLKKGFRVLANEEVVKVYEKNNEFAEFLTDFLSGKPKWLEAA